MGQLIAFLSLGSYNKIINYHLILWRARIMNEELFNEATKSNVLTGVPYFSEYSKAS